MNLNYLRFKVRQVRQRFGFQALRARFLESQIYGLSINKNKTNLQPANNATVQIKKHQYFLLNQYFLSFCNSRSVAGRVNGQHLSFVTGSKSFGKTDFIESNLKQFIYAKQKLKNPENRKTDDQIQFDKLKTPQYRQNQLQRKIFENQHFIILKFNFEGKGNKSADGFMHHFQEQIIKNIVNCSQKVCLQVKKKILCRNLIRQIILSKKTAEYLHIYIKKVVFNILEDKDSIYFSDKSKEILFQFNQKTKNIGNFEYLYEKWEDLVIIFIQALRISEVQATIRLILSAMKQIQHQYRPKQFQKTHYYQSGIQTTKFLFQILNFLCGVGTLNKNIVQRYFSENQNASEQNKQLQLAKIDSVQKCYFQSRKVIQQIMANQENFILNGNHIDVVMVFMNFESLNCFNTSKFQKFFDYLLVTLNNYSNLRTHFPVIMEIDNSALLKNIQNTGMMRVQNPSVIDIPGYITFLINNSNIKRILDEKVINKLFPVLGRNPSTWNTAIKLLSQGASIEEIVLGKNQIFQKQKIKLRAKINQIYCLPQCIQEIDSGEIKYEILLALSVLVKLKGIMDCCQTYYFVNIFDRPIYQGLKKMGVVYQQYYLSYAGLTNMMHLPIITQIFKQQRKKNYLGWMFWKWWKKEGFIMKKKQLKYNEQYEKEFYYYSNNFPKDRGDFFVRYYYGAGDDYYKLIKMSKTQSSVGILQQSA